MLLGFGILFIAGLCQGSFGRSYKYFTPFSWAAFWGIYNIMCATTAGIAAFLLYPKLVSLYINTGISTLVLPLICGVVWGLSSICFSKGIDKIGMSLVYGISMGISTIFGSLMPMILKGDIPHGLSRVFLFFSLALTIVGVAVITVAGVKRDGAASSVAGLIMAAVSGLGSGAMNLGFNSLDALRKYVIFGGGSETALSALQWFPVLLGGSIACILYCIGEVTIKKEWHTVIEKGAPIRVLKLFGTSIIWYAALALYGISAILLGHLGGTVGWILFNSLSLIVSIGWGLKTNEWLGKRKNLLFIGCLTLIIAWVFSAFCFQ